MKSLSHLLSRYFFFNDTATTEIYTLSLHDALPISSGKAPPSTSMRRARRPRYMQGSGIFRCCPNRSRRVPRRSRSEDHTSELQSHLNLVCRLLLVKKISLQCSFAIFFHSPTSNTFS